MKRSSVAIAIALSAAGAGCHNPSAPLPSTLEFTTTPIDEANIEFVVPIGNLSPPGHTLPSDHTYFYHRLNHPSAPQFQVVAPAGGVVKDVRHDADDLIRIQATPTMTYYMGHVIVDAAITRGKTLRAGDRIGVTSTLAFAMDLGLVNSELTLFFITPTRYPPDTPHADSPFKYFSEALRSRLYAKEKGTGHDGKIDFDQTGKLVGNWFHESLSVADSPYVDAGSRELAFVRDVDDPSAVRVSIGGTLSVMGVWAIPADATDPANVTIASGLVSYRLVFLNSPAPAAGVLLVQLLDTARIKVETFPGSSAAPSGFTGAASIYVR
jgi:hypothetical protein